MESFFLFLSRPFARESFIFFIRVWFGSMMMFHGSSKLFSRMDVFAGHIAMVGFPFAEFIAYIVVLGQLFGGVALLFGLLARPAALILTATTFGAVLEVFLFSIYTPFGRKGELTLFYFLIAFLLLIVGPGKYSLDDYLYRREQNKKANRVNEKSQHHHQNDESLSWDKMDK